MTDKLKEEILNKEFKKEFGHYPDDNFKFSGYIISAMQEYAELWHTAKMQDVTDEEVCHKNCRWFRIGYGHCTFCIRKYKEHDCKDNFEPI